MTCHATSCPDAVCHVPDCAICNAEPYTAFCATCKRELWAAGNGWCPGVRDCYDDGCHMEAGHDVVVRDCDVERFAALVRRWM